MTTQIDMFATGFDGLIEKFLNELLESPSFKGMLTEELNNTVASMKVTMATKITESVLEQIDYDDIVANVGVTEMVTDACESTIRDAIQGAF